MNNTTNQHICDNVRECMTTYRDLIEALIENSNRINREMGMLFYIDKQGKCTIGTICAGDSCSVSFLKHEYKNSIGTFHVHLSPITSPDLTHLDISTAYLNRHEFACVGSKEHGINCFAILYTPETNKLHDISNSIIDHFYKMNRQFKKIIKVIRDSDPDILRTYPEASDIEDIIDFVEHNKSLPDMYVYQTYSTLFGFMTYAVDYLMSHEEKKKLRSTGIIYYLRKDMKDTLSENKYILDKAENFLEENKSKILQKC